MSAALLLAIGMILIFIEFFVPGALIGVFGGILVLASVVVFASGDNSLVAVLLYIFGVSLLLGFLIKFALWKIKTAKADYSIYSDASQDGYQASSFDASAIGKKGVVVTDLKPGGHIMVDGERLQAISQSGYLTKGTEVLVIGGQEESLIVKLIKKDTQNG